MPLSAGSWMRSALKYQARFVKLFSFVSVDLFTYLFVSLNNPRWLSLPLIV